jgi:hypothetical protein
MGDTEKTGDVIKGKEDAYAERRFQMQCFLASFWTLFAQYNRDHTYNNFVQMDEFHPIEMVGKMTAVPELQSLMDIPPELLSSLIARVRIYKVFYENGVPSKQVELKFDDHMDAQSVESITSTRTGRGFGMGLKEFYWEFAGAHPGEVDHIIKAKMVVHFQTMQDMSRIQADSAGNAISFMDIISPQPEFVDDRACVKTYNSEYFRIKAVVGYASPRGKIWNKSNEHIAEAIRKSTMVMNLNLTTHNLDFRQDGTIEVSLDFVASVEQSLNDTNRYGADVLEIALDEVAGEENKRCAKEQILDFIGEDGEVAKGYTRKTRKVFGKDVDIRAAGVPGLIVDKALKIHGNWKKNSVEKEAEAIERERRKDKAIIYQQLIGKILQEGRLFYVDVEDEQIGYLKKKRQDASFDTAETRKKYERVYAGEGKYENRIIGHGTEEQEDFGYFDTYKSISEQLNGGNLLAHDTVEDMVGGFGEDFAGCLGRKNQDGKRRGVDKCLDNLEKNLMNAEREKAGTLRISYFYYGDLLEAALEIVRSKLTTVEEKNEIRFIVGSLSNIDPFTGGYDSTPINLSDIAISVDWFMVWFLNTIIKPQREQYPLKLFIKDTIDNLIGEALAPECFGEETIRQALSVGEDIIAAPLNEDGTDRLTGQAQNELFGNKRTWGMESLRVFPTGEEYAEFEHANYFTLYVISRIPGMLDATGGNAEEDDSQRGISWFRLGSDRGLVKKITFKRVEQQYLREANLFKEGGSGPGALLREKYNADIMLFGNMLYRPGMMCYIDPTSIGAGRMEDQNSVASRLNLGGYYVIVKTMSTISPGKFDTEMECIWEASGVPERDIAQAQAEESTGAPEAFSVGGPLSGFGDVINDAIGDTSISEMPK